MHSCLKVHVGRRSFHGFRAPWRRLVVGSSAGRSKAKLQVNDPAACGSFSLNSQWLSEPCFLPEEENTTGCAAQW